MFKHTRSLLSFLLAVTMFGYFVVAYYQHDLRRMIFGGTMALFLLLLDHRG